MAEVDKATTLIRLKGKVTVTCCLSENELGNVFKYLLEKVWMVSLKFHLKSKIGTNPSIQKGVKSVRCIPAGK